MSNDFNVNTDYYKVLGVSSNASAREIKLAFHSIAKECHPDVSDDPQDEKRFKAANEAHEVLSDPDKRHSYDQSRFSTPSGSSTESSQSPGPTWSTVDQHGFLKTSDRLPIGPLRVAVGLNEPDWNDSDLYSGTNGDSLSSILDDLTEGLFGETPLYQAANSFLDMLDPEGAQKPATAEKCNPTAQQTPKAYMSRPLTLSEAFFGIAAPLDGVNGYSSIQIPAGVIHNDVITVPGTNIKLTVEVATHSDFGIREVDGKKMLGLLNPVVVSARELATQAKVTFPTPLRAARIPLRKGMYSGWNGTAKGLGWKNSDGTRGELWVQLVVADTDSDAPSETYRKFEAEETVRCFKAGRA